jgi:hypothetical protein
MRSFGMPHRVTSHPHNGSLVSEALRCVVSCALTSRWDSEDEEDDNKPPPQDNKANGTQKPPPDAAKDGLAAKPSVTTTTIPKALPLPPEAASTQAPAAPASAPAPAKTPVAGGVAAPKTPTAAVINVDEVRKGGRDACIRSSRLII